MLKVEELVLPSPEQFEIVIKGMRLPMKSGNKSDSGVACKDVDGELVEPEFYLGEKDKKLLLNLCSAGDPSHRKVLRQLPVIMNIKAPHYFWKQLSTYKIGTTANSESLMHTSCKEPFTSDDFSIEALEAVDEPEGLGSYANLFGHYMVEELNHMRDMYLKAETPKEKRKWELALFAWMPESFNQTRTWSANYEVLLTIINQRMGHKLPEWQTFIDYMLENVPYLKEILEAVND